MKQTDVTLAAEDAEDLERSFPPGCRMPWRI